MSCGFRIASICGREPWTTTSRVPRLWRRLRSCTTPRKVSSATTSPPKAMTIVLPRSAWIYGAAARIHGTNGLGSKRIPALGASSSSHAGGRRLARGRRGSVIETNPVEFSRASADQRFGEACQRCVGVVTDEVHVAQCIRCGRRIADELVGGRQVLSAVKPGDKLLLGHTARCSMDDHVLVATTPMRGEALLFDVRATGREMRQVSD